METLISSSFLAKYSHLQNISSFKTLKSPQSKPFKVYSSSTTFNPKKNPTKSKPKPKYTFKTHKTPKNPSPKHTTLEKTNNQSLLQVIFKSLDNFISTFIDLPLHPSIDPKHILSGNFAPVDELPPTVCKVIEGSLPSSLTGAYIRNGPNPQFIPNGPYHLFDGDGMLHAIKISEGKVTYCCRFVKTHKYILEHKMGYQIFPSIFSSFNGVAASIARLVITAARLVTGQFGPLNNGFGTANTGLSIFGGKMFALCESDLPYIVKLTPDGDIITLGRHDFQSSDTFSTMTAHPKVDQETGEVFAYAYNIFHPFLTFFRIDSDGRKQKDVKIFSMERFSATHDFAVTKNYAIFPDLQIVGNFRWILRGKSPIGVDVSKPPRIGIIPRSATDESEMRWIDAPGLNMLHCVNSWEEDGGDTIVVVASNMVSIEQLFENIGSSQLTLEKIIIDLKRQRIQRTPLSKKVLDFAVINPAYAMKKNRFVYAGIVGDKAWVGVVKIDLSLTSEDGGDCTVASRMYGPGCGGGEPFFVAREPGNPAAEEDDGYLVTYVHDDNNDESKFVVMDAKSPSLEIIAAVKLPRRVPIGFHGLFVSESELKKL